MNYRDQEQFLNRYAQVGIAAVVLALAATGMVIRLRWTLGGPWRWVGFAVVGAALGFAVFYVPKYLLLTVETTKKFSWTIRIRWVLTGLLVLFAGANARSLQDGIIYAACIGALVVANLAVRRIFKRGASDEASGSRTEAVAPFVYFTADWLTLALLVWGRCLTPEGGIFWAALTAHLLFLITEERRFSQILPAIAVLFATLLFGGGQGIHLGALSLWMTASLALIWMSRRRHQLNERETLETLSDFTGEDPEEVQSLLVTSTGTLARNWHAAPPKTEAETIAWYEDNAQYYIYDLSQFHLTYKNIAFSLDVLGLLRGRVLDFGAGIGDIALEAAARGFETTYFDVDGESQRYARWRARERGLRMQFASERDAIIHVYDTIICLDVLEHVSDPEETLEFLVSHLAPGGRLIASIAFGPTKAHPMHFDHTLDVPAWLKARGFKDVKGIGLRFLASDAFRKSNVIVFEKIAR
jgi:SAM-dependent methyltransferase